MPESPWHQQAAGVLGVHQLLADRQVAQAAELRVEAERLEQRAGHLRIEAPSVEDMADGLVADDDGWWLCPAQVRLLSRDVVVANAVASAPPGTPGRDAVTRDARGVLERLATKHAT
jgi:hypothetical protein